MNKAQKDLEEIKGYMERSTRFISLSGLSGVFAGVSALLGALVGKLFFLQNRSFNPKTPYEVTVQSTGPIVIILVAVLVLSLSTAYFLTRNKAKKNKQALWDNTSKRMLINLQIPLITGGIFASILLYQQQHYLLAPSLLIFYGLALINGSKYTLNDIRGLGFCEIALGLLAMVFYGNGLLFWCIGFGALHIVYGGLMYRKYEK